MIPDKKPGTIAYPAIIIGSSLAFLIYVIVRAVRVPITIDEAATYLNYVSSDILAIFRFDSTNNHFLNTLLTKICWSLGGPGEFVLRLPNLLAYVVYLFFCFRIVDKFAKDRVIAVCGFLLFNLNPYVLDFFSLSRGYGLSLAFLMAALFFFFSFLDGTIEGRPGQYRQLNLSLTAAALAVLSNFSLLNVYVCLVAFAFGFFIILNSKNRPRPPLAEPVLLKRPQNRARWFMIVLAAVFFNLLVISQDLTFAKKFFEPVIIKITGLSEPEKQDLQVFWVGYKDQEKQLSYQGDLWKRDEPVYYKAVKFRCLTGLLDKINEIEVTIGRTKFTFDAGDLKSFKDPADKKYSMFSTSYSMALKRSILPIYRPAINWRGDRFFFPSLLIRLLLVVGIGGLITLFVYGAGRYLRRRKILTADQFRPLAWTTWGLGIFILYALTILKRGEDLPIWGTAGHIWDTVFSLINNSFYGILYFPRQERVIFLAVILSVVGSLLLLFVRYRKKDLAGLFPEFVLLVVLVLSSILIILQNILLGNPYLFGRTGLFLIPLFMLFFLFLVRDLSRGPKSWKIVSRSLLGLITILCVFHFARTANTVMTVEWRSDTDIKSAIDDLEELKRSYFTYSPKISLGVYDPLYATLQYHLRRQRPAWLELNRVPPFAGNDFYLLSEDRESTQGILSRMILIKKYPLSENVLLKHRFE
jgi:hypothetical protein